MLIILPNVNFLFQLFKKPSNYICKLSTYSLIIHIVWIFYKRWASLASTRGNHRPIQANEALPHDQADDQAVVAAADRLPLSGHERHHLQMRASNFALIQDDSIIFKAQLLPRELEEIWIEIFNYINGLVNLLKPTKMILMALDGVAPRCKMNNQRSRRYRSAQDYKEFMAKFYGYTETADSQENFKNNSISPGTQFMEQLNEMLHFFIQKKISEDDYWKELSIVFTGSDTPGEG